LKNFDKPLVFNELFVYFLLATDQTLEFFEIL